MRSVALAKQYDEVEVTIKVRYPKGQGCKALDRLRSGAMVVMSTEGCEDHGTVLMAAFDSSRRENGLNVSCAVGLCFNMGHSIGEALRKQNDVLFRTN